jgi:hypothetical protein
VRLQYITIGYEPDHAFGQFGYSSTDLVRNEPFSNGELNQTAYAALNGRQLPN